MKILGINAVYHESAAALLVNGELISFVEEERLNRIKHGKSAELDNPHQLPVMAIKKCLDMAGLEFKDVDVFAYSFAQSGRLQNIGVDHHFKSGGWGSEEGETLFNNCLQKVPEVLSEIAGFDVSERLVWVDHHLAHAASAFLCSPFKEALVLVVDGIGEFDSISAFIGRYNQLGKVYSLPYPHSLGLLWEKFCRFLGFSEHDACKLMDLSSYGDPQKFRSEFSQLARPDKNSLFVVDNELARFRTDDFSELEKIFGPARQKDALIEMRHKDIAAALQEFTQNMLLELALKLKKQFRINKLCLAGGVALNCVANAFLQKQGGFPELFVQPAANDAGSALGAALYVWCGLQEQPRAFEQKHAYYGPEFSEEEIRLAIKQAGLKGEKCTDAPARAASLIAQGKIVGWFNGRMEMGSRSLGNRSLLADPRLSDIHDVMKRKNQYCEDFKPFSLSVLSEKAGEWFDVGGRSLSSEFMLFAYPTRKKYHEKIPAVVHVDRTSRIHPVRREINPDYYNLISEFDKLTGVPLVLNTSFDDIEPIVMSPEHAINIFLKTGIDVLFLNKYMIEKPAGEHG